MSWADLEALTIGRTRADGSVVLVARDSRPAAELVASKAISTIVAIGRIVAGRWAIAHRHGGRGVMVYAHAAPPPFLIEAVTAAGGVVYDGSTERVSAAPLAATIQLDAAFVDLATAVSRRLGAKTFGAALDVLESALRRRPIVRDDPTASWIAALELVALAGELVREHRLGRWVEAPGERFPLALDLGNSTLFLGKLALAIVTTGEGTMHSLDGLARHVADTAPLGRPMPMLVPRTLVSLERLSWTPLLPADVPQEDLPAVAWVEDLGGGHVEYPVGRGAPTPELIARGLRNLAAVPVELHEERLGEHRMVAVADHVFAAEKLLDPATMRLVAERLTAASALLVAIPTRSLLLAIDAMTAMTDDALMSAFVRGAERMHRGAGERDRITPQVIVYHDDRPLGRVERTPA